MEGLEDIATECDWFRLGTLKMQPMSSSGYLNLRLDSSRGQAASRRNPPPAAKLHKTYDPEEVNMVRKVVGRTNDSRRGAIKCEQRAVLAEEQTTQTKFASLPLRHAVCTEIRSRCNLSSSIFAPSFITDSGGIHYVKYSCVCVTAVEPSTVRVPRVENRIPWEC